MNSMHADDRQALRFAGMMGHTVAVVTSGHGIVGCGPRGRSATLLCDSVETAKEYSADHREAEPTIYIRDKKRWKIFGKAV